eukprot:1009953_1
MECFGENKYSVIGVFGLLLVVIMVYYRSSLLQQSNVPEGSNPTRSSEEIDFEKQVETLVAKVGNAADATPLGKEVTTLRAQIDEAYNAKKLGDFFRDDLHNQLTEALHKASYKQPEF